MTERFVLKTVCYITLHTTPNYGSCLQAYATQSVFESLGWRPLLVDYWRKVNQSSYLVDKSFKNGRLRPLSAFWARTPRCVRRLVYQAYDYALERKRRPFRTFQEAMLYKTKRYLSVEQLASKPPLADVYCTGSDQVWNSTWNEGFDEALFLSWAPIGKPRIAFAASIGKSRLEEWEKPQTKDALYRYDAISMREASGVCILEDLGFTDVSLVLDPTLLISKKEWERVSTIPEGLPENYILVYQLNPDDRFAEYAKRLSSRMGVPLVKVCYRKNERLRGAVNLVTPEVTDFIGCFLRSACIVTDSFHATAFSLNFEKPFVSISPGRFSTRIESILELTGLKERLLADFDQIDLMERPIDFESARASLSAKRDETLEFLRSALDSKRVARSE